MAAREAEVGQHPSEVLAGPARTRVGKIPVDCDCLLSHGHRVREFPEFGEPDAEVGQRRG